MDIFRLRREVLFVRNENETLKSKIIAIQAALDIKISECERSELAERDSQETILALTNELKTLRVSFKNMEEKIVQVIGKNHDLEARILEEKLKMAETLNSMNEIFDKPGKKRIPVVDRIADTGSDTDLAHSMAKLSWGETTAVESRLPMSYHLLSAGLQGISIPSIAYNNNGHFIASGGSDGTIQMWEPAYSMKLDGCCANIKQPVLSISMSGNTLLATSERLCYIFSYKGDNQSLALGYTLSGHTGSIVAGKLTADSRFAITGGRRLKVWDVASGKCLRTIECYSKCLSVDVNISGNSIVSGHADKAVRMWDLRTGDRTDAITTVHKQGVTSVSFSPTGRHVLTNSMDSSLAILESSSFERTKPVYLTHPEYRTNPWWSKSTFSPGPDNNGFNFVASGSKDGALHIWSTNKNQSVYVQKSHSQPINCVAWRPDGRQIATCDNAGAIFLWNCFEK